MSNRPEQHGIALVAVLWLVALLTILATASVTITTSRVRVARAVIEQEQARLLADSAIRLVLVELASPMTPRSASDPLREVIVFDQPVQVEVRLEDERLNVNTTDREELQQFFEQQNAEDAAVTAARIVDWRDSDTEPLAGGAESSAYRRTGLTYSPRNRPFESTEEVRQVIQMKDAGLITVYGPSRWPAALPNRQITVGDVLRLRACTTGTTHAVCRTAVARLTGSPVVPLQIFAWR